jgi:hypothetical protein
MLEMVPSATYPYISSAPARSRSHSSSSRPLSTMQPPLYPPPPQVAARTMPMGHAMVVGWMVEAGAPDSVPRPGPGYPTSVPYNL